MGYKGGGAESGNQQKAGWGDLAGSRNPERVVILEEGGGDISDRPLQVSKDRLRVQYLPTGNGLKWRYVRARGGVPDAPLTYYTFPVPFTLKMEAAGYSETMLCHRITTWHHNPYLDLYLHRT
jgi:hypothetical protein